MTEPTEQELHAYVDGRLEPERKQMLDAQMKRNPQLAQRIQRWQQESQALRVAMGAQPELTSAPWLDPSLLRQQRRRVIRARWLWSMLLGALITMSGGAGWFGFQWLHPAKTPHLALQPVAMAFQSLTELPNVASDAEADQVPLWLQQHFAHPIPLPDLAQYHYQIKAVRLLSGRDQYSALVLYQDAKGHQVGFYFYPRQPSLSWPGSEGLTVVGDAIVGYWQTERFNLALVSDNNQLSRLLISQFLR